MKYSNVYESNAKAPYVYDFVYNQTTLLTSDYYQEHILIIQYYNENEKSVYYAYILPRNFFISKQS